MEIKDINKIINQKIGERVKKDNLIWICCCCGCLPIMGIIKGIIIVAPITLISTISCTGITIILLLRNAILTYKALCKTSLIGINVKIIGMLILPIAIIVIPVLVFFGSFIFGFIYGLFCPSVRTFDDEYNIITGGFVDVFKDIFKFIDLFWYFNYERYFDYLVEFENKKTKNPFDISIPQLIVGMILTIYGAIVGVTALSIMWVIK